MTMAAQAHDAITPVTATPVTTSRRRRVDAGVVQLSQRDIDGLLLCGEHSGAPFDLLATALRVEPDCRMPPAAQLWINRFNHVLIAGFGALEHHRRGPRVAVRRDRLVIRGHSAIVAAEGDHTVKFRAVAHLAPKLADDAQTRLATCTARAFMSGVATRPVNITRP